MIVGGQGSGAVNLDSIEVFDATAQPTATTNTVGSILQNAATGGGNVISDGGASVTSRGVCWATTANPTTANSKTTNGTGTGTFTSSISGLLGGTIYYVRAYATNSVGTSYGAQVTFTTTAATNAVVTTTAATGVTSTGATSGGNVTSDGGAPVTVRGICWSTAVNPTVALTTKTSNGTGTGSFTSTLSGLTGGTLYYVRAYATNSVGTSYGADVTFTTAAAVAPVVTTTTPITGVTSTGGTGGGNVTSDGGASVTLRGICWSTATNPTVALTTKTSNGTGTGSFTSTLSGLTGGTLYYVRAYATNSAGTSYGANVTFTTAAAVAPVVTTTTPITGITSTGGTGGGNVTSDGGASVTVRGICWSTSTNPTIALTTKTSNGTGTGSFTSTLSGLTGGTLYYVRAYATNSSGTSYGADVTFTTAAATVPVVTTTTLITGITTTGSAGGGTVTSTGGATVTVRGVCWSTTTNPTTANAKTSDGTGAGSFPSTLTGLTPSTLFYVRAYATNSVGTSYGANVTFTTSAPTAPVVTTTTPITGVTATGGASGGNVTSDGGAPVTVRGICWSTSTNPTVALTTKTSNGTGTGSFTSTLSGLTATTLYYVRAYATNSTGTSYGANVTFTTVSLPVVTTTTPITGITSTGGTGGGNVTSDGGAPVTVRGVCWSTSTNPTVALTTKTSNGTGTGSFTSTLSGLTGGTLYYVRAYTTNSAGTSYGANVTFTTTSAAVAPVVTTTTPITGITSTGGTGGGNVTSDGGASVTVRGICWSTATNPTIALTTKTSNGTGTGSFTSTLSGLTGGTLYYVRAYATNSVGTSYGADVTFTTSAATAPVVTTTTPITGITSTGGAGGGNVTSDGGASVTVRGICWSTSTNPTIALTTKTSNGTGTGSFTSTLSGLAPSTLYYVRAYATSSVGTSYGSAVTFTTTAGTPPVIVVQPASRSVTAGSTATFSVTATGTPTPTYQWRKDGAALSGATGASYQTPTTILGASDVQYSVTVSNVNGPVTSENATLAVIPPIPQTTWSTDLNVTATFEDPRTGGVDETVNGNVVRYTNSTSQIRVRITATSVSGATIDRVEVGLGNRVEILTGATGDKLFTVTEGTHALAATVYAHNAAGAGKLEKELNKRLVVDRTKPAVAMLLPKRFWLSGATGPEYPLVRTSNQRLWINGMTEAWNEPLRRKYAIPYFGKNDVAAGLVAAVIDATGIDTRSGGATPQVYARPLQVGSPTPLTAVALSSTSTNEDKPGNGASSAQRLLITGMHALGESRVKGYESTSPGDYSLRFVITDKAGNVSDPLEPLVMTMDTIVPEVSDAGKVDGVPYGGTWNRVPFRWFAPRFDESCAMVWQGTTADEAHQLKGYEASNLMQIYQSSYRIIDPVAGNTVIREYLRSNPAEAHYLIRSGKHVFTYADEAGNKNSSEFTFKCTTVGQNHTSEHIALPLSHFDRGGVLKESAFWYTGEDLDPSASIFSPRTLPFEFFLQPTMYGIVSNYPQSGNLTVTMPVVTGYNDWRSRDQATGISYRYTVPLDPETTPAADAPRRVRPAVITVPPSWKTRASLVAADEISIAVIDKPTNLTLSQVAMDVRGIATTAAVGDAQPYGTVGIKRTYKPIRADIGYGGWFGIDYLYATPYSAGLSAQAQSYEALDAGEVTAASLLASLSGNTDYANAPSYWLNTVMATPDIAERGTRITVRLGAGFFNDLISPSTFSATGNYVQFYDGSNNVTRSVTDSATNAANPTYFTGKIAILEQRLIASASGMWYGQALELDLSIDAAVPAKLYDIHVKLGAVHSYSDELSVPYVGANGAHLMSKAFMVHGMGMEQAASWDTGFVPGWEVERTQPLVVVTAPADGAQPQVVSSSGYRSIRVTGYVDDLAGKLTSTAPVVKVGGTTVSTTAQANGRYTFQSDVKMQGGIATISVGATNAFGVTGERTVYVAEQKGASGQTPSQPPTSTTDTGNWIYGQTAVALSAPLAAGITSLDVTQIDVKSGTTTTTTWSKSYSSNGVTGYLAPAGDRILEVTGGVVSQDPAVASYATATLAGYAANSTAARFVLPQAVAGGLYASQLAEVRLTSSQPLSSTVVDVLSATIYRPFRPALQEQLTESAVNSLQFSGSSVTVSLKKISAGNVGTDGPALVAIVTATDIGLQAHPIVVSSNGDALTPTIASSFASSRLLFAPTTGGSGQNADDITYRVTHNTYPDLAPPQRAKRLVLNLPATYPTLTYDVTTKLGVTHRIVFTTVDGVMKSKVLPVDANARGNDRLSAWPVRWTLVSPLDGFPAGTPPPPKEWGTVPDVVKLTVRKKGGSAVQELYVHTVPEPTAGRQEIRHNVYYPDLDVEIRIPTQKPGDVVQIPAVYVTKYTMAYVTAVVASHDAAQNKFTANFKPGVLFKDDDASDINPALLRGLGLEVETKTISWPCTLDAMRQLQAGAMAGGGEAIWEDIQSPITFIKAVYALGSIDWATINAAEVIGHIGPEIVKSYTEDARLFHDHMVKGNFYEAGVHGGRALYTYGSFFIPGLNAAKVVIVGAKAAAVVAAAAAATAAALKYRKSLRGTNNNRAPHAPKTLTVPSRVSIAALQPPAVPPMHAGPTIDKQPINRDISYQFPNPKYPTIAPDGRRLSAEGPDTPICFTLDNNVVKPPNSNNRWKVEKTKKQLFPGHPRAQSPDYDRGHILADSLGGRPDLPENFIPIKADLNQRIMNEFEQKVRDRAHAGSVIEYKVHLRYVPPENVIPREIRLEACVDGVVVDSMGPGNKWELNWMTEAAP